MPIGDFNRRELLDSARSSAGFGGIRPTSFGSTVDSSTLNIPYRSPFDPRNDPNDPWARKGAGVGFTPPSTPTVEPTPEPEAQPQNFFERFPTPQEAWKDWLSRMGQFLARQPGEVPNFPGPWGSPTGSPGLPPGTPGPRGGSAGGYRPFAPPSMPSRGKVFEKIQLM